MCWSFCEPFVPCHNLHTFVVGKVRSPKSGLYNSRNKFALALLVHNQVFISFGVKYELRFSEKKLSDLISINNPLIALNPFRLCIVKNVQL